MKLSVIIPCLNAAKTLAAQLEALANESWSEPWEVIIADNGSRDESVAIADGYRKRLAQLRVVDASDRPGQAHAKNVGAKAAAGGALAFCDADDEVAPGWVAAIGEALGQYDFVASRHQDDKLNAPWVRETRPLVQRDGVKRYKYIPSLLYAGGCGLGIKRRLHEAVGGFDESLPVVEDVDYCFRVQLAGATLHFVKDAVVQVRYQDTLQGIYHQRRRWAQYHVLLYKRYVPLAMRKYLWKDNLISGLATWRSLSRELLALRGREDIAAWLGRFALGEWACYKEASNIEPWSSRWLCKRSRVYLAEHWVSGTSALLCTYTYGEKGRRTGRFPANCGAAT